MNVTILLPWPLSSSFSLPDPDPYTTCEYHTCPLLTPLSNNSIQPRSWLHHNLFPYRSYQPSLTTISTMEGILRRMSLNQNHKSLNQSNMSLNQSNKSRHQNNNQNWKHFHFLLEGRSFTTAPPVHLSKFTINLVHLPGSQNMVADAFSRPSSILSPPPFPVSAVQSLPSALPVDFSELSSL